MRFVVLTTLETVLLFMTPCSLVVGYQGIEDYLQAEFFPTFQQIATRLHEVINQKAIIQNFQQSYQTFGYLTRSRHSLGTVD